MTFEPLKSHFDEKQSKILEPYCTSTTRSIFALKNLPEVVKGALFSRYSRSYLGLRELLLRDFIQDHDSLFDEIALQPGSQSGSNLQSAATQKAQSFYDRILDGYGDDSIGELGGAHLALENVSMLAAKAVEDKRIGGSPLEKSTRYIYFDRKIEGKFPYLREKKLMELDQKLYEGCCDHLFSTYQKLIEPLTEHIRKNFPQDEGTPDGAYNAALRAKVLDCLRGLLPASTLTNMGLFGNGRFFEGLLASLANEPLDELQEIALCGREELSKVIPSFIRRSFPDNRHFIQQKAYQDDLNHLLKTELVRNSTAKAQELNSTQKGLLPPSVRLIDQDPDAVVKILASLLFDLGHLSFSEAMQKAKEIPESKQAELFEKMAKIRTNRRHKSPRALEHPFFLFEIEADFGVWRDLQRHRMLTQQHQPLGCDLGYTISSEIEEAGLLDPYCEALEQARKAHQRFIELGADKSAQYIVPMAYRMRWKVHLNLRAMQWLCELRSSPAGHTHYRQIAQEMTHQLIQAAPSLRPFFKFVDMDGHSLGRMQQEKRRVAKESAVTTS